MSELDTTDENHGRNSAMVAAGIAISRLAGLIRAALVFPLLNTTAVGDAFVTAMRIPNLLQNLLGEGALSAAFIPEYTRLRARDEKAAGALAGSIAAFLLAISGMFAVIGIVAARPITRAIAWGFTGETFEWAVRFVRIFSVGAGFLVLSAWCLGVLNSHRRFFLSYVAPVVWNAAQIAVVAFVVIAGWGLDDQATAIAWAVVVGGVLQFVIQLPAVRRADPSLAFANPLRSEASRVVIRRLGPAVLGRGAMQLSAFADLALATLLAAGAPIMLASAQPLYILPLSLIALSAASASLPSLSTMDGPAAAANARATSRDVTFLVTLVVVLYITVGDRIVWAIFSFGGLRSGFDDDAVVVITAVLIGFSIGLPAMAASRQLQNVLFSQGDTRAPSRISAIRITIAFVLGVAFMFQMDRLLIFEGDIVGWTSRFEPLTPLPEAIRADDRLPLRFGAVGLALASAIGAMVELVLLRRVVRHRYGAGTATHTGSLTVVSAAAAIFVGLGMRLVWPGGPLLLEGAIIGAIVVAVYLGAALAGNHPAARTVLRRLGRGRV